MSQPQQGADGGGPVKRQLTPAQTALINHSKQMLTMLIDTQSTEVEEGLGIPEDLIDGYYQLTKDTLKWLGGME